MAHVEREASANMRGIFVAGRSPQLLCTQQAPSRHSSAGSTGRDSHSERDGKRNAGANTVRGRELGTTAGTGPVVLGSAGCV
jgi:hypothetical protein